MNDIPFALLGFVLGILSTTVTQAILRRWQRADNRQRLKLESLRSVQAWMEAYRDLLKCDYPEMSNLCFYIDNPSAIVLDPTVPNRVYQILKEYRDLRLKFDKAEMIAHDAIDSLGEKRIWFLDRLTSLFIRSPEAYDLFLSAPGFPRKISGHLKELSELHSKIYHQFQDPYLQIDWHKLDFIQPEEVITIIHTRLQSWDRTNPSAAEREIRDEEQDKATYARNSLPRYKRSAQLAIDGVLRLIREYEKKWLPSSGS